MLCESKTRCFYVLKWLQYGVKIFVITSFKDTCSIEILPQMQKSNRGKFCTGSFFNTVFPFVTIFLSFHLNFRLCCKFNLETFGCFTTIMCSLSNLLFNISDQKLHYHSWLSKETYSRCSIFHAFCNWWYNLIKMLIRNYCMWFFAHAVIFLSFWAEVHYNSIYPEGGKIILLSPWNF